MNAADKVKCWICGALATSGEHLVKASMLRELFGKVTQRNPLFHSSAKRRNRRLQSVDAKAVKLHMLCEHCNSTLTQPFDRAWDDLWSYLRRNESSLKTRCLVRRNLVYQFRSATRMLDLHLYAVKLFGCVAASLLIPVDLAGMASSIKLRRAFPNIYLGIGKRNWLSNIDLAGSSDVNSVNDSSGSCVFAVWFLTVGAWEFQFIYAEPGQHRKGLLDTWNPVAKGRTRQIRLKHFGSDD